MGELGLEIAGLRARILTRDPELGGVVRERYKGFLSTEPPEWRIEVKSETSSGPLFAGDVVLTRDGEPTRLAVQRGDFAGTLDLRQRRGAVTLGDSDELSVDSFVRITYSLALLDVRGLIVHASSLARRGRAYLFCGRSGRGKTTIARLSPSATLLSDELSVVRLGGEQARCYSTPFRSEVARAGEDLAAPLQAVYFLHHGSRHVVEAVKPRQALERFLPNVLFFAREPALTARVLAIAADLVETLPCFDLFFRLDPGFWELIDGA